MRRTLREITCQLEEKEKHDRTHEEEEFSNESNRAR